jgi:hypothetical protein
MSNLELEVLIGYLYKTLYFISRNLPSERNPALVALMTRLANAIKPIYEELKSMQ